MFSWWARLIRPWRRSLYRDDNVSSGRNIFYRDECGGSSPLYEQDVGLDCRAV
jgi:hypothetical protein